MSHRAVGEVVSRPWIGQLDGGQSPLVSLGANDTAGVPAAVKRGFYSSSFTTIQMSFALLLSIFH